jgi:uncharacterized membrane protein required for colicin V production
MGLDVALGVIVLLGAIRGWLKGFVSQAVRIAGFIACFYLADPVQEQARPYVLSKLPTIDPGLMDRILWWVSAVVSYVLLVGLSTLAIQLMRSPPVPGAPKGRRDDQFAGFLLGAAKAALLAAFVAAGVQKYGPDLARHATWVEQQTSGSHALKWTTAYQPVPRIWSAPPVRQFVEHIQRNGLRGTAEPDVEKKVAERNMDETQPGALPRLELAPPNDPGTDSSPRELDLGADLVKDLEEIKAGLRAVDRHR